MVPQKAEPAVPPKEPIPLPVLKVAVDDVLIEDPFAYRAQSPPGGFTFIIPEELYADRIRV